MSSPRCRWSTRGRAAEMTGKDRSLNVPKPKRRNVSGFDATPPSDAGDERSQGLAVAKPKKARSRTTRPVDSPAPTDGAAQRAKAPQRRRTAGKTTSSDKSNSAMVRVHTTLSVDVVKALRDHVSATQRTQTEVLAESFLNHSATVTPSYGAHEAAAYEAAGFRPPVARTDGPEHVPPAFHGERFAGATRHVRLDAADAPDEQERAMLTLLRGLSRSASFLPRAAS